MRTGEERRDGRTGVTVVVLADADDTGGRYALVEIALPGGLRTTVRGPDPLPRVELEVLHGTFVADARTLRAGDQLVVPAGQACAWDVPPGPGVLLLVEVRPGAHLRAVVQMLLEPGP